MPAKGTTFCNDLLKSIFNATAISDLASATDLYVSLHTASPGASGNQSTNEASYGSYARVAVSRSTGWTVTGNQVSPAAAIAFPASTSGSQVLTHFGIGVASSGNGKLLYYGAISPTISISDGIVPQLTATSVITEQ